MVAFALGAVAALVVEVLVFVAVAIVADANDWSGFSVGDGPLLLLEFERRGAATTTTFGGGMAIVAVLAGVLNAAGAAFLGRRE
ncbi:MAG TPA: hypothetical protein VE444_05285 [Gaiellaceae bacterium]|jgi:hypothetical protein|nr:hypothetical protein [Gaiellaceae bacterium]